MKKSIAFLPKKNREDLKYLVELILDKIPVCEMIILYGSYARGTYVSYDEREEFGIPTSKVIMIYWSLTVRGAMIKLKIS